MKNAFEYIERKGWQFKNGGKQLVVKACPLCGKDNYHFFMNAENGCWDCKVCGESGNLFQLKKRLGDVIEPTTKRKKFTPRVLKADTAKPHADLLQNEQVIKWLQDERGLSVNTIKHFNIQFRTKHGKSWVGFPYYYSGKLVNVKWRTAYKHMEKEPGYDSTLYNIDSADMSQPLIITEGEFDCMAAWQIGFTNVISVADGAQTFKAEWLDDLADAHDILLAFDNDAQGEAGAEKAAGKLGRGRCRRVRLPYKDFNECLLQGMTRDDIQEYIDNARPYRDSDLLAFVDLIERVRADIREPERQGVMTGWSEFDELLNSLRQQEVTTITGDTGAGKTTFMCNLCTRLVEHGVVWVSSETSNEKILRKMYGIHLQEPIGKSTPDSSLEPAEMYFSGKRLFFLDVHGEVSYERIRDTLEYCARRGVKFAILDNLHFFLVSKSLESDRLEIERFMRALVKLARSTGMHVFLVCHPSKLHESANGKPPVVKPNDLKGASAIKQDSHNIMSLWRNPMDENGPTILYIHKVRDDSGLTGKVMFHFDHATQTYWESGNPS